MPDAIHPKLKYEIIWSDLSEQAAADKYEVSAEDVRRWRVDYAGYEDMLQVIRDKLESEGLNEDEDRYWRDMELGLRFFLGGWFGRPIGDDNRVSDEAYEDLWRSRAEYLAGAYGKDSNSMRRWWGEVGRTLCEGTIG